MATDDKHDDAEVLQPDTEPALPPRAQRSRHRDDEHDDRDERDDRDDDYHPRGRKAKYDEDGNEITSDHTTWAMMSHLGVVIGWFVFGPLAFLAPLIIWLTYAQKSPFVVRHAKESLNHFISFILWMFLVIGVAAAIGFAVYGLSDSPVAGVITGYALGLIIYFALNITALVFSIFATVAASKGEEYRYRFTIRLIG